MKVSEIRDRSTTDLHGELDRVRRHLFDLRAQAVTEKLENPTQLGQTKKVIARILTVLNERGETGIEEKQAHLEKLAAKRTAKAK